jgi:hypothetical protein
LPASAAPASKLQEPALFVREAIWAWKAKDNAAATEALDAALALGDKSADADLLESKLAYEKFGALPQTHQVTISTVRNGQRVSVTELRQAPLRDRAIDNALLTEALISYLAFVQAGGTSSGNFNVHAPMVQIPFGGSFPDALVVDATEFLAQRDEQGESGWDDLRELGRQMLELPGTDLLIKLYVLSAPTLARDPDQLVSWYERALFYPKLSNLGPGDRNLEVKGFPGIYFPLTPDSALGPRFRNDLVAVQKWRTLLDRGLADPQYRARTLLVLAADGSTPEQLTYYQQYLQELAQHAGLLRQSGELDTLLQMDKYTARLKPTDPAEDEQLQRARVSLIISLLNSLSNSYPPASNLIAATKIPNDSLTDFQRAYVGYRGRCLSAEADQEKRQTIEDSFRSLEQALRQSYPDLVLPELSHPSPQTTALFTINHLWSPSLAGITMPPTCSKFPCRISWRTTMPLQALGPPLPPQRLRCGWLAPLALAPLMRILL